MKTDKREKLKEKRRIVVKVGSSSLCHPETGRLDLYKLEVLVRQLANLQARGMQVVLVSSGAINTGRHASGLEHRPETLAQKQACASIGQARLMMIYQKLFLEYNTLSSQVLLTRYNVVEEDSRRNAINTFEELLEMGVIPIVNENDTVSTYEIRFGDNDTLSAVVTELVNADLLVLLSDIDGLYTADPTVDKTAELIEEIETINETIDGMAGDARSDVGTGGMKTKLQAARIATGAGADMVIANGKDFHILHDIVEGKPVGTLFHAKKEGRHEFD